ncbi:MAG: 1-acyl-sn-glycerol-3-phosphate acyltransferase [Spirochaetaceae bacterium]|jgi:1-acyl-sn-glycerol-3-phosphate acyltransferase|nr:1-acyl-sn-glycerol-3-phosphate acyltransferase [Spirochaetaceae bacterium]
MISVLATMCAVFAISYLALGFVILYPLNKRWCAALANFAVRRYPRIIFAILRAYANFRVLLSLELQKSLPPQYLVISNHQSLLDIPVFMLFLKDRARFVAKEELSRHVPIVAEILRAQEHCFLPRSGNMARAMRAIDSFAQRVWKEKLIPVIFPEGTRSKDGTLGTFYQAGFRRFLDKRPMPVVVCALDGGYRISTLDGIIRKLTGGVYRLKILKIFPPPLSKREQIALLQEGKELIEAQLKKWRAPAGREAPT